MEATPGELLSFLWNSKEFNRPQSELEDAAAQARKAAEAHAVSGPPRREILRNLVGLEISLGRIAQARLYAARLIRGGPGKSLEDRLAYAETLLAGALPTSYGSEEDEEPQYRKAIESAVETLGDKHPLVLRARDVLRNFLLAAQQYGKAMAEQREICEITREVYGEGDDRFVEALNRLALIHDKMGEYDVARTFYQAVLEHRLANRGTDDLKTAEALYNLAELARASLDYAAADRGLREVVEREERLRGRRTPLFVLASKNLALLELAQGHHVAAEVRLREAFESAEQLGPEDVDLLATTAEALGILYESSGQPEMASSWAERAFAQYAELAGPGSHLCARVALVTARCQAQLGHLESALAIAKDAVTLLNTHLDPDHPETTEARHQLAVHYAMNGRWPEAFEAFDRTVESDDRAIASILRARSRRGSAELLRAIRTRLLTQLAVLCASSAREPARIQRAFEHVLKRKAIETAAARLQKDSGMLRLTGEELELRRLRRRRLRMHLRWGANPSAEGLLAIEQLRESEEKLESRLASSIPEESIRLHLLASDAESVSKGLPKGACLMEIVDGVPALSLSRAFERNLHHRILAFVLRAEPPGSVALIELGDSRQIAHAVAEFRVALENPGDHAEPSWFSSGERLRALVFDPLRESLGEARQIVIASDGALDRLVFEALPDGANRFLLDDFCISYVQCGRELSWNSLQYTMNRDTARADEDRGVNMLRVESDGELDPEQFERPPGISTPPVVVADPDFDASLGPGSILPGIPDSAPPDPELHFPPLAASAAEGAGIARRLNVKPSVRASANKLLFANLRSPEILHISTHGFLVPRASGISPAPESPFLGLLSTFDDPLLRCGLALAGANASVAGSAAERATGEGLLWAAEVVELDLRATDLAVLSACHTGLGHSRLGDGATGLRRAFRLAGARSVISSMWAVGDDVAQEVMAPLYDRLLEGEAKAHALWYARLALRKKYPHHPNLWGAFVLEGYPYRLGRFSGSQHVPIRIPRLSNEIVPAGRNTPAARLLAKGLKAAEKGKSQKALSLFNQVRRARGVNAQFAAEAEYEIAEVYRESEQYLEAVAAYTKLLSRNSLWPTIWLNAHLDRGHAHVELKNFAAAIQDFTDVLLSSNAMAGEIASALVNRGYAFLGAGNLDAALEDFSTVVIMDDAPADEQAEARIARGKILARFGDYNYAILDYSTALSLPEVDDELRCRALVLRGVAYEKLQRIPEAIKDYEAAANPESLDEGDVERIRKHIDRLRLE
jgi:CHAT domain-containing protein/thioredoxin-like negative regulator of GroEL